MEDDWHLAIQSMPHESWSTVGSSEGDNHTQFVGRRKRSSNEMSCNSTISTSRKRTKIDVDSQRPLPVTWDKNDHSCAFDVVLVSLYTKWRLLSDEEHHSWSNVSPMVSALSLEFGRVGDSQSELDAIRDWLRVMIRGQAESGFASNTSSTDIFQAMRTLFHLSESGDETVPLTCTVCDFDWDVGYYQYVGDYVVLSADQAGGVIISQELSDRVRNVGVCRTCGLYSTGLAPSPPILFIEASRTNLFLFEESIEIPIHGTYGLLSVIWHRSDHFVTDLYSGDRGWTYDGLTGLKELPRDGLDDRANRQIRRVSPFATPPGGSGVLGPSGWMPAHCDLVTDGSGCTEQTLHPGLFNMRDVEMALQDDEDEDFPSLLDLLGSQNLELSRVKSLARRLFEDRLKRVEAENAHLASMTRSDLVAAVVGYTKLLREVKSRLMRLDEALSNGTLKANSALVLWRQSWRYECDAIREEGLVEISAVIRSLVIATRLN
ncbi:hypothetical protein BKA70DRAFT_1226285 [Coprinopsis sp. MPI-PUGE-AT-0042]|nr:hypothetical protein BKA70DRAFT_1226285 [Coprinopsis sp. MPI-PUGE-AT-0042]